MVRDQVPDGAETLVSLLSSNTQFERVKKYIEARFTVIQDNCPVCAA